MEGLMLADGLTALCRATVHRRGWCILYLRLIMLVSMTTADPPAEDWPLLASNVLQQSLGEVPHYTDSPSALQTSSSKLLGQSSEVGNMLSARPIIDPPKASENYYSRTALGLAVHGPEPLSVPGLTSSEWTEGKRIGFEVSSRLKRNVKAHRVSSDQRTDSSGVQLSLTSPRLSVPALNISSSELISAALDSPEESPFPLPELQTASADQVEPSRRIRDFDYLHPSYDLNIQNDAKPDAHLLNPSHTLLGNYRVTSSSTEPTMGPLENFFLTSTMDVDYGSGDYLETVSFMGSVSLVTNLPSDVYEFEDSNSASYDTSFPTRVGMPLSTRLLSPSPISATYSTHVTTFPNPTFAVNHNATISPKVNKTALVRQIPTSRVTTSNLSVLPRLPTSIPDIMTHLPIYSTIYSDLTAIHPTAVHSLPIVPTISASIDKSSSAKESSDTDWPDNISIEPTDVLLPDMNSLEYYTIQLSKGTVYLPEQESNHTSSKYLSLTPVNTVHIKTTATDTVNLSHMLTEMYGVSQPVDNSSWIEESSTDIIDFDPFNSTILDLSEGRPHLVNTTELFPVVPSETLSAPVNFSTSLWDLLSTPDWTSTESVPNRTSMPLLIPFTEQPGVTPTNDTDISRFANSSWTESPSPTPPMTSHVLTHIHSALASPTGSTYNTTFIHPMTESADQGTTAEPSERPFLTVATPSTSVLHNETTVASPSSVTVTMTKASDSTILPITVTTLKASAETTTVREYLCNITKPDGYLVRAGFSPGSTAGFAKAKVREILKAEFNRSVELQVVRAPPDFVFWAVSGRVVYTAASVMNVLRKATHSSRTILSVSRVRAGAGLEYHVHSVLQFVPSDVDVHVCTFSEHVEKGLSMAFAEVLRRSKEYSNFTVRVLNITLSPETKAQRQLSGPVDITFVVCDAHGYILGSEVSALLRQLSMVEFSYYMGYPVQQIAEPFYYPELNTTQLLRSSWVRTVLLGVREQHVRDKIFQAKMERRLAVLLGEGLREEMGEELGRRRRFRRATRVGNNSVQIVQTTRLMGSDNPLDMIYFVEGANGERLPATTTAELLNRLDVQHAAIVLGYRIQGALAQPVEKQAASPSEMENATTWIIVGVVVPVVLVVIIIAVLYWKLCRTDKLEFQPDAVSTAQQRQKKSIPAIQRSVTPARTKKVEVIESIKEDKEEEEEERRKRKKKKDRRRLQPPSVKGFDFAKLHLGQHSKDDLVVIQEPLPLPAASKEPGSGETVEASSPKSKGSSTKTSRCVQLKRGRISPSDGDSLGSDPPSERESPEENPRLIGASVESRQQRRPAANGQDGPSAVTGADEHLSSASMFEHVERGSRSADAPNKRFSSNIQLIALQPIPALAVPQTPGPDHTAQSAKINKEIQVALRQKSEIEHHRNKIRLRAKRKGHYDFPTMHHVTDGLGDPKEQDRIYQKAQMQIDKILDPHVHMPPLYTEPKKSGREKRSPRQKKKQHMNGDVPDADRDRLLTTDSDGTYKKYPGVNNVAYVSDPDQGPELSSPSPSDDVFLGPVSPPPGHAPPPPPYLPPQPSIEEARQQMHSLLDDAFALVSPSAQGSNAGITLPGAGVPLPAAPSSPPSRGPPPWGPSYISLSPFPARYAELGLSPPAVQGLVHRSRYPPGDAPGGEQPQSEVLYNSRGGYMDEMPSSARPRPVGGSTGAQLHHLTQMDMSSSVGEGRSLSGLNWGPHHHEEDLSKPANRDPSSKNGIREPTAPPAQLDTVALGYPSSAPPEEYSSPSHSSASLIKAIREELMRLSQKQAAVTAYHS